MSPNEQFLNDFNQLINDNTIGLTELEKKEVKKQYAIVAYKMMIESLDKMSIKDFTYDFIKLNYSEVIRQILKSLKNLMK